MASSLFAAGLSALRRFWRPFVLIQSAAVALVAAYHASAAVRAACAAAAGWKARGGLPFVAITGAIAGALLPELAKLIADRAGGRRDTGGRERAGALPFRIAFFAVNGMVVDLFYRFAARLFGSEASVRTVVSKMAFDQFVFTPLWLAVIVVLFLWRQRGYSVGATLPALRGDFYRARVVPILIPNWCFWIPTVSIIYALPMALQFLLFVLVLAAWSLIMVFIADGHDAPA